MQKLFPRVRLIRNTENLGGTGGFNTGLFAAFQEPAGSYEYIWLLDNDVLVHPQALQELIHILEAKDDVAIAGSTMMQLDCPWRINEMGSFLDRGTGRLYLNRHLQTVDLWRGSSVQDLMREDPGLDAKLEQCRPLMDVEYVAAASLLVRFDVAKKAGLWMDFFIHYDDVEWCLRVADMGWRVVVSARSLIWHVSGIAKVPTWVQYYDIRNMLYTLNAHGADKKHMQRLKRRVAMKGVYATLIGKSDIGRLHFEGLADFEQGRTGKKDIRLDCPVQKNAELGSVLMDPKVRRVLIPSTVNMQGAGIQEQIVRARRERPELQIDLIFRRGFEPPFVLPTPRFIALSRFRLLRYAHYLRRIAAYDLVFQSDYEPLPLLSLLGREVIFVNNTSFARYSAPDWRLIAKRVRKALTS